MSYNKMKFIVGLFVLSLLFGILLFLYQLLKEKGSFQERYSYYFHTYSAASFYIGMPLKFSGFNIGTIDDIALQNDGSVNMTFSVNEKNRKWISKESVLLLRKPLIGAPHIELFTALDNPVLPINSRLTFIMSDDIDDMISKLEPAIDRIIHIIENIDTITTSMAKDGSLLTTLTGDAQATKSIISSLKQTDKIMKDIRKITSKLEGDIIKPSSSAIHELDAILKDVKQKLSVLDATVKVIGGYDKDLMLIKDQISAGVEKSNQIMDKIDSVMQSETSSEILLP